MAEAVPSRSEGENQAEAPKTNGQLKEAEEKSRLKDQKEAPGKEEPQAGQAPEIAYSQAKIAVDITEAVGEAKEKKGQVRVSSDEMESLKRLIKSFGLACGINSKIIDELDQMPLEQVVLLAHKVLKNAKIIGAGKVDLARIAKIKEYSDEKLAEEKVRGVVTLVEDFGRVSRAGGPGTTEPAEETDWTLELPDKASVPEQLGRYVEQIEKLKEASQLVQMRRLPIIDRSLHEAILKGEIADDEKAEVVKKVVDGRIERLSMAEAEAAREARKISAPALKEEINKYTDESKPEVKEIKAKFRDLDRRRREELVGDIERHANTYYKQILSGWTPDIDELKVRLLDLAKIGADPEALEFRQWRAATLAGRLDAAVSIKQIFETPVIWEETPEKLNEIYRIMEATDLSVEDMSATINRAIDMISSVAPDTHEGRTVRTRLVKELEAFRAIHSLRIQLERHDMDPTEFLPLYRSYFDDETLIHFVERFALDEKDRQFWSTRDNQAVNLLDVSFELYSQRLRDERIKMNMIEEMTRHGIENPFSDAELRSFEEWLGIPLTDELKGQIKELRMYFKAKMQAKIDSTADLAGYSVDDIWGMKKVITLADGREVDFLKQTHDVIDEWYRKKTLQGASGMIEEDDLAALREEFGPKIAQKLREKLGHEPTAEELTEEVSGFLKEFKGKDFLDIRRRELLEQLENELKGMGLAVKDTDNSIKSVDFGDLREFGTLESIDLNAYHFAWLMEWSSYDSIRIYARNRESQWRDDYDHLVFHQGTNLFFGRQIDQTWEFLHEQNENRGRPKENDVNRIWKSFLPGKHSWMFPQNGLMTRWADFFMTDEQKALVELRTREIMRQWDFDNEKYHKDFYDWMRSVVKRDMIESGEISFGKEVVGVGGKKLSEVAEAMKVKKFEFIDIFIDRQSHKKFTDPAILQDYLANPTEAKFLEIGDKVNEFYSSRDVRLFPWMTLALRAHWEVASKHRQRLFNIRNLNAAAGEGLTDSLIGVGQMDRKQGEHEKRNLFGFSSVGVGGFFGTTPFRRVRQGLEDVRRIAWELKTAPFFVLLGAIWGGFTEFIKQFPKQVFGGGNR